MKSRDVSELRANNSPNLIIDGAISYFRSEDCKDAAYVLKQLRNEPQKLGQDLRKFITERPVETTQVSKARALAYILDRNMTRIDYEETCKLVNTPGNYLLPSYSVLSEAKKEDRPEGEKIFSFCFFLPPLK